MLPYEKSALLEFHSLVALKRREEIKLIKRWAYLEERQVTSELGFTSPHTYLTQELKLTRREAYELIQLGQVYNRYPRVRPKIDNGLFNKESLLRLKKIVEEKSDWNKEQREDFITGHMNLKPSKLAELGVITSSQKHKFPLFVEHTTIGELNSFKSMRGIERGLDEFISWLIEQAKAEFQRKRFHSKTFKWVFKRDKGMCQLCGSQHDLEIDHIHPKFLGGPDIPENLRLLCRRCNVRAFKRCQPLLS